VSTGQGCAKRTADGGVALTRAERRGSAWASRSGARWSDCRRIFGLYRRACRLRAIMEIRARGANRCSTASRASAVIGASPRRSDRCAIVSWARCSSSG